MPDDAVLNNIAVIERCLLRIREEYRGREAEFPKNFTMQDSIILNLLRACEAAIDVAMHLVRIRNLGIPQDSRDAFALLESTGLLTGELSVHMQSMVGFRNIAVHDDQKLNLDIVQSILSDRLRDFESYCRILLETGLKGNHR